MSLLNINIGVQLLFLLLLYHVKLNKFFFKNILISKQIERK